MQLMIRLTTVLTLLAAFTPFTARSHVLAARGELELRAVDSNGEPTAVRMRIRNPKGRPFLPPKLPRVGESFVFDGQVVLSLPTGHYTFEVEKGPEHRTQSGHFVIESGASDNHQIEMSRFVDMRQEGWWSGDLHVEMPLRHLPLMMLAEDLHLANAVTWSNQKSHWQRSRPPEQLTQNVGKFRFIHLMAGRDRRRGSEVIVSLGKQPFALPKRNREFPAPFSIIRQVSRQEARLHLNRMDCLDLPVWIASGRLDSAGLLHPGLQPKSTVSDATIRTPDSVLFPEPHGIGRWSQQIYFRLLECGLRIPPAASSGAGITSNPVGYNRAYVHCGQDFSVDSWWDGLRKGKVVLTNGPLLRPRANGQLPGHVFQVQSGQMLDLEVEAQLGTREKIDYFEIIKNGRPEVQVRLEDWVANRGRLPAVTFDASGWMMVRVVTRNSETYRCACSGPFYVEFDGQPRVNPEAVQFFLDWIYERARAIEVDEGGQRADVLRYHRAARDYWQGLLSQGQDVPAADP